MGSRRCWVYPTDGSDPVEVTPGSARSRGMLTDAVLWNDRAYQDMGDARFNSRASHREYMRQRGLTTVDDYRIEFQRKAQERERFYRSAPDPSRAHDLARALERHRG